LQISPAVNKENNILNLPRYFLIAGRPAKIDWTEDSRVGAYDFNLQTGEFKLVVGLYHRLTKADNENVDEISEEEFGKKVREMRKTTKPERR